MSTIKINSKLPNAQTSIFAIMSGLAKKEGAINLSQGFPNFESDIRLKNLIDKYIKGGYNQYAPMPGVPSLRKAIAKKVKNLYDKDISFEDEITITAGATQALFTAITAIVSIGDEVILVEPAYDSYAPTVILCGGIPIPYALKAPSFGIDWDEMKSLVTSRTKMIIINTPHNPTGSILQENDMKALDELTKNTNIIVISDEVYEHIIFDNILHESALKYPDLYDRSMITYSFGKTYHSTGWKLGYTIAPPYLTKEFRKVHQFNVFSVNTPMQHALADFVNDARTYQGLGKFYQEKRDFFLNKIKDSRFKPLACNGTYFMLLDYSNISDEPDTVFAKRITREHKIATIPISVFYSDKRDKKIIRVCFAKTNDVLSAAAEKLCEI